jgi:Ca2+-binding EF-hand superfamily protein
LKKVFDKNKDGFIDKEELYDMLSRLGEHITEVNRNNSLHITHSYMCVLGRCKRND